MLVFYSIILRKIQKKLIYYSDIFKLIDSEKGCVRQYSYNHFANKVEFIEDTYEKSFIIRSSAL